MPLNREDILVAAKKFCAAFSEKADVLTILTHFSKTGTISVYEHGDCALAPFLGRQYEGEEGVRRYFETIGEERKVGVKGHGRFKWLNTGEIWNETFAYVLDFDEEGKVIRYQIWANTGAAYLARMGMLKDVQRKEGLHGN